MTNIVIQGETFDIGEDPYKEGHALNVAEARSLNQTRRENIRNNMAKAVAAAKEKGENALQAVLDYASKYTFSMPGAGGTRVVRDPVEKEAYAIAREMLKSHLAKSNRTKKDVEPEKYEAELEKLATRDDVMKLAKKHVSEKQKLGNLELGEDSLVS